MRNITKHQEKQDLIIRVNFHTPVSVTSHIIFPNQAELKNNPIYIKELSFKSQNMDQCVKVLRGIKDLQKAYRLKCSIEQKQLDVSRDEPL